MLNSDPLIRLYRCFVSFTVCIATVHSIVVIVAALTTSTFPHSLPVLDSVLFGRVFLLITEVSFTSRSLRQLAQASGRLELTWVSPDFTIWSAAITAILASNIVSLQNHEPISWSIGVTLLLLTWRHTVSTIFHRIDTVTLDDQQLKHLERLAKLPNSAPTVVHLLIFLISQLLLALVATMTPPSFLTNSVVSEIVALHWPVSLAAGVMLLAFAALSLPTTPTRWWIRFAVLLAVEFPLAVCVASIPPHSAPHATGPFLQV